MRQCASAPLPLAEADANRSVRGAGRSTTQTPTGGSAPEPLQRFFLQAGQIYRMFFLSLFFQGRRVRDEVHENPQRCVLSS